MTQLSFDQDALVRALLTEAKEDYIGLWQITADTRDAYGAGSVAQDIALMIVRRLLEAGLQVGQFKDFDFQTWPDQNVARVIGRIKQEWSALGTDPGVGDIAWFWLPR